MKHFQKSIGQSLITVLMTSTVLEVYMLPIFGASNPPVSPSPSVDIQSPSTLSSPSAEAAIEVATPETIASPKPTDSAPTANIPTAATSEAAAPKTVSGTVPEAVPETVPGTVPEAVPETVPEPIAPATPTREVIRKAAETQPTPVEATRHNLESAAESDRLAASRQVISERLAALVNRDRLSKEVQLQQNLVALALYYAQLGEFADARQVAQHPALSLELQAATLAEIEKLVVSVPGQSVSGQPVSGVPGVPGQPVPGQPGQVATLQTVVNATSLNATSPVSLPNAVSATPITTPIAGSFPEGGYMTVPSTPELLQPYLSDRCLNSANSPAAGELSGKPVAVQPQRSSPFLPIGQQVASRLSVDELSAAQVVKPTAKQTQPVLITQTVKVSRVAPIAQSLQPQSLQPQKSPRPISLSNAPASGISSASSIASGATGGDRLTNAAGVKSEMKSVGDLGMVLPAGVPKTLQSILEKWMYSASPSDSGNLPSKAAAQDDQPKLSSLPQLIKLSREATKISPSPALNKSVATRQTAASSSTSGYWKTIAANCGGLQADSITVSSEGNRLASGMIFPLPISVPLTSGFGWRTHPIGGDRRFHSGIDLGAPFGTPVLSALAGRVVSAGDMGGYGLAVIVEASSVQQQNLYAHLSAIAVKPGDRVEQGSVLGLVGSTGSSTGPHLHFETLLPSTEGWTAVDPLGAAVAAAVSTPAQVSQ